MIFFEDGEGSFSLLDVEDQFVPEDSEFPVSLAHILGAGDDRGNDVHG